MDSIPAWPRTDRWLPMMWQSIGDVFTERMGGSHWQRWNPCIQLAMERSKKDWMKTVGKQRDGRDKASPFAYLKFSPMNYISISIFIFMFYSSFITIWVCLTKIYKMTIACFILTISVGSTLTHVRFITWTTQCTCWLVVRSCVMPWYWATTFFGAITGDYESCEKVLFTISRTKFLAPLPGIVQVLSKLLVTSVPRIVQFGQLTVHLVA